MVGKRVKKSRAGVPPPLFQAMPERKHFFFRMASLSSCYVVKLALLIHVMILTSVMAFSPCQCHIVNVVLVVAHVMLWSQEALDIKFFIFYLLLQAEVKLALGDMLPEGDVVSFLHNPPILYLRLSIVQS